MEKRAVINVAIFLLILLGVAILYLGMSAPKLMWPPVITGLGFFVISWVFYKLRD